MIVHQEAGYIDAALHLLVHRVTRRRCTEGWVHISFCAQLRLTPAKVTILGKPWLEKVGIELHVRCPKQTSLTRDLLVRIERQLNE